MLALKEFRSKAKGLPDLLPWAGLVDDGVVLTKSGAFLAGWEYRGPDLDSATNAELNAMAARLNAALLLEDGWSLHVDSVRAQSPGYAPQGRFPDRTTRLIDDARRVMHEADGAGYTTRFFLIACWHPDPDSASKASALFTDGGDETEGLAARTLARFRQAIQDIEDRLSGMVRLQRLRERDTGRGMIDSPLLAHLQGCVEMQRRDHFVMPEVPMYLDAILGNLDLTTGFEPIVGQKTVVPIGITGFPAESFPGMLDFLARLPVEYRWSNRFIYLSQGQAETVLSRFRSKWAQKRKSLMNLLRENSGGQSTHINLDADEMTGDAIIAMAENSAGIVRYGYYTSVILLAHEDPVRVREVARQVLKMVTNTGFSARVETVNAVEALLGSMPGNVTANVRRPLVNTLNLAHLLPFTSVWAGPDTCPCPFYPENSPPLLYAKSDGGTPFRVSLHAGDLGHTAIVGPTGSGKSTLLATLVAQHFRYPKAQAFVFDKGYSMLPLVMGAGGEHYDIAGEGADLAFCPLGRVDEPGEVDWAAGWLETLCELQGVAVTPGHRAELYRAVAHLAESTTGSEQRTMTNLLLTVQDASLREALQAYTLRGQAGNLLDADSDALGADVFQVFELEHLMNRGERIVLPVLLYLFHRLEQRFKGQPTLLVLDEAWLLLGHPVFREKIREWLKVLRKANVAVVFATQSLTDLTRSGIADVIYESCPTKILLPNAEAMTDNVRPLYEAMGLNARQVQIISTATPKRQYYVLHPEGRRLFDLGLTGPELAFVGSSGKADLARIRELARLHGQQWPAIWLQERGQLEAAELWLSY